MAISQTAAERTALVELGPVELKVLSGLRCGLSNQAICDEIGIDADGLKAVTRSVLKRLGVRSRKGSWRRRKPSSNADPRLCGTENRGMQQGIAEVRIDDKVQI